uniref:carbonic anhydrase n=1 Tax=Erythrolobus australicus TaxID=1077150 RepID=A0A7S1TL54_9RHOD
MADVAVDAGAGAGAASLAAAGTGPGGVTRDEAAEVERETHREENAALPLKRRQSEGTASTDSQGRANVMVEPHAQNKRPKLLYPILFLILGWLMAVGFLAGLIYEVTKDRSLYYDPSEQNTSQWSYIGVTSPPFWANLSDEFTTCAKGRLQSPINVNRGINSGWVNSPEDNDELGTLADIITLPSGTVTVQREFENFAPMFYCEGVPCLNVNIPGIGQFSSNSFMFRTPSEHVVDAFGTEAEIQFYATDGSAENGYRGVIVSAFMVLNANNSFSNESSTSTVISLFRDTPLEIRIDTLLPPLTGGYIAYNGSLSYPPCTEGYRYVIAKGLVALAPAVGEYYASLVSYPGNARNTQPDNGRAVLNYGPAALPSPQPTLTPETRRRELSRAWSSRSRPAAEYTRSESEREL